MTSEFEQFFEQDGSKYGDGIMLSKYGDNYSLVAAKKSTKAEGTVFKEWCFPQDKDRKPREKSIPLGVRLGNRTQTIAMLYKLIAALGESPGQGMPQNKDDDESIPF